MDKDENLFEDQIDEDDDLLNISLDELSGDEIDVPVNEEPDEDIIELIDLLEKGDDDLLGIDDDLDDLTGGDISTEDLTGLSDDDTMELSSSDLEVDDLLLDSETVEPEDHSEPATVDELDQLFSEDPLGDLAIETEETGSTDDTLEKLLEGTELEELTADTVSKSDDIEDLSLQMEDIFEESNELDQADLLDDESAGESVTDDVQDDLFGDLGLEDISDEKLLESDDEILDELDNELDEAIVSSDDESGEESLWESDLQGETAEAEDQIDTSDVNFDEIDDIPLDSESLEDLLSESVLEESVDSGSGTDDTQELDIDAISFGEPLDESLTESDEAPLDEDNIDDLFSESDLQADAGDSEPDFGDIQELSDAVEEQIDTADVSPGVSLDDAGEKIETGEDLFSEETAVSDESPGDIAEEVSIAPVEGLRDETDTQITPDVTESSSADDYQVEKDIPAAVPQVPVISEEKVEQIVRDVVGEVVERIAREVFTEVAEKVITEAIDSLKKSLETDSE